MLCLRCFHGDRGAPWWHPGSNSSLYRLCERQSSWYLGPHNQTQMQMLGQHFAPHHPGLADSDLPACPPLNWQTLFQQKGFFFFLLWSVFFSLIFSSCHSRQTFFFFVLLADIRVTSSSAARHSDEFTQSSSHCSPSCEVMRIKNRASFNYTHM